MFIYSSLYRAAADAFCAHYIHIPTHYRHSTLRKYCKFHFNVLTIDVLRSLVRWLTLYLSNPFKWVSVRYRIIMMGGCCWTSAEMRNSATNYLYELLYYRHSLCRSSYNLYFVHATARSIACADNHYIWPTNDQGVTGTPHEILFCKLLQLATRTLAKVRMSPPKCGGRAWRNGNQSQY